MDDVVDAGQVVGPAVDVHVADAALEALGVAGQRPHPAGHALRQSSHVHLAVIPFD